MARFGRPDATGRSSGKLGGREGKLRRPPKSESWCWLTVTLLASPAWRGLSVNGRRLIDFLLIEHCHHAGRANGDLMATHEQLRAYGLTGDSIRKAIEECVFLGLIAHQRGGRWGSTNRPSRFRLTFYPDAAGNPPTNEWDRFTEADLTALRPKKVSPKRSQIVTENQKAAPEDRRTVVPT